MYNRKSCKFTYFSTKYPTSAFLKHCSLYPNVFIDLSLFHLSLSLSKINPATTTTSHNPDHPITKPKSNRPVAQTRQLKPKIKSNRQHKRRRRRSRDGEQPKSNPTKILNQKHHCPPNTVTRRRRGSTEREREREREF